jgi:hypothetical protein
MNGQKIVQVAASYIGKTEKPNNSGFKDAEFEKRMVDVGWVKGASWCAYFCELVCKEAYSSDKDAVKKYSTLFSGSATATYKNFDVAGLTSKTPEVGSLAVWRLGNGWQGHIGIVAEVVDKDVFKTIEGNTNDNGGREGYIVTRKTRFTNKPYSAKSLNLIGFIKPL